MLFNNFRTNVTIKWPNDIYIGNKNLRILTEMVANYDEIEAIICGIGINMNHVEVILTRILKIKQQVYACIPIV